MTIGERIRELRKAKGMTQKQVGENCGMPDSAIRKYEHGVITPKRETLKRIADALGVDVASILVTYDFSTYEGPIRYSDSSTPREKIIDWLSFLNTNEQEKLCRILEIVLYERTPEYKDQKIFDAEFEIWEKASKQEREQMIELWQKELEQREQVALRAENTDGCTKE